MSNMTNVSKGTASTCDPDHKNFEHDIDKESFYEPKLQIFRTSMKSKQDNIDESADRNNTYEYDESYIDVGDHICLSAQRLSNGSKSTEKNVSSGSGVIYSSSSDDNVSSHKKV